MEENETGIEVDVPEKEIESTEEETTSKKDEEDFIEINSEPVEDTRVNVKIETLRDFLDADRIQELLREGNVIFLRIRDLREKNISELKKSVDKLKKTVVAMDGDIVGVDEDFLVITPQFAKIFRGN